MHTALIGAEAPCALGSAGMERLHTLQCMQSERRRQGLRGRHGVTRSQSTCMQNAPMNFIAPPRACWATARLKVVLGGGVQRRLASTGRPRAAAILNAFILGH